MLAALAKVILLHPGSRASKCSRPPGCSGPVHLCARLDHTLEQPLYAVAVGILNVAAELDEGVHFLVSCLLGPEKLRGFEGCSGARSKLKKQSPGQFAGVLIEARFWDDSRKPRAVFLMRAVALG